MLKKTLAGMLACCSLECALAPTAETPAQEMPAGGYALLVIDMQRYFVSHLAPEEAAREIPNQIEVIRAAQRNDIPVFVLQYLGCGPTIEPLMDVISGSEYHLVIKAADDGFPYTNLDELLKEGGVGTLVLAGINASFCVLSTARGAVERGYDIVTSPEIIGDSPQYADRNESAGWYQANGTWIEGHDELVRLMDGL